MLSQAGHDRLQATLTVMLLSESRQRKSLSQPPATSQQYRYDHDTLVSSNNYYVADTWVEKS